MKDLKQQVLELKLMAEDQRKELQRLNFKISLMDTKREFEKEEQQEYNLKSRLKRIKESNLFNPSFVDPISECDERTQRILCIECEKFMDRMENL